MPLNLGCNRMCRSEVFEKVVILSGFLRAVTYRYVLGCSYHVPCAIKANGVAMVCICGSVCGSFCSRSFYSWSIRSTTFTALGTRVPTVRAFHTICFSSSIFPLLGNPEVSSHFSSGKRQVLLKFSLSWSNRLCTTENCSLCR